MLWSCRNVSIRAGKAVTWHFRTLCVTKTRCLFYELEQRSRLRNNWIPKCSIHFNTQGSKVNLETKISIQGHCGRLSSFIVHFTSTPPTGAQGGVYSSGFSCRIWFSRFGVRPCCFRAARSQKPLKKSHVLSKTAIFRRFFVSGCFKSVWSHPIPIGHLLGVIPEL